MLQAAEAARLYERVHAVVDARGHDRLGESLDLLLEHEAAQRLRTYVRGVAWFGSFSLRSFPLTTTRGGSSINKLFD